MVDEANRDDLRRRLSRIEGQARGIKKMVDEQQDTSAILVQLMALQKATRAASSFLLKSQATQRIKATIRDALEACPGECDHCEELEAIDLVLESLDLDALLQAHLKVTDGEAIRQ